MNRSIYLVNPAPDFPSYFNTEVLEDKLGRPTANAVALALPTVAAMIPGDFEVTLCDECVKPVDFDFPADFVGITGMVSQWKRMREIAQEFRSRGKVVLIGGPHASLRPEVVRPHCDILVRGEIEDIAARLFQDLINGSWRSEYVGTSPDLANSPVPRLDLYPNERTLTGAIQTSRGCPFRCEFCDVIQYQGRKQRHKPIPQILVELDQLHAHGYRYVFITDDNLTAHRKRAKELLAAIRDWNDRRGDRLTFATQISIDAASDDELLQLCAEAGIELVFVGIETPNEESLREVNKHQNNKGDMVRQIERFVEHGISVIGGMIVGFDSDGPDIFRRQYEFAMSVPIPFFTPAILFAPETTPLFDRLNRAGRVFGGSADLPCTPWVTNIVPLKMTREEAVDGLKWLCNKLYCPDAFEKRVRHSAEMLAKGARFKRAEKGSSLKSMRPVERDGLSLLKRLPLLGFAEARMAARLMRLVLRKPCLTATVIRYLILYMQVRHMFDRGQFWDPELAEQDEPWFEYREALARAS